MIVQDLTGVDKAATVAGTASRYIEKASSAVQAPGKTAQRATRQDDAICLGAAGLCGSLL